ncbi:MAG: hypothetical protein ACXABL_15025 [Candidatus Thorarchaeota archaeon]|jgi:hypothetical protein
MAKVELRPFNCPACKDGNFVKIEIDEDIITKAKRLPGPICRWKLPGEGHRGCNKCSK